MEKPDPHAKIDHNERSGSWTKFIFSLCIQTKLM